MKYSRHHAEELFNSIASHYDKTNTIVSLGTYSWMLRMFVNVVKAELGSGFENLNFGVSRHRELGSGFENLNFGVSRHRELGSGFENLNFGVSRHRELGSGFENLNFGVSRQSPNLQSQTPIQILDIGAGTGELSLRLHKKIAAPITLLDISGKMLEIAKNRIQKLPQEHQKAFSIIQGDATNLPFADNSFSITCSAFLLRNVANYEKCFSETLRVLKPNGKAFFLELSRPKNRLFAALHRFYLSTCVPTLGAIITSDKEAYSYLHKSIMEFPDDATLTIFAKLAQSRTIVIRPLLGGIARILILEK